MAIVATDCDGVMKLFAAALQGEMTKLRQIGCGKRQSPAAPALMDLL
jgi:hypothetical protein